MLVGELLQGIFAAGPVDGVLLDLHGSTCVGNLDSPDGLPDAEGYLLAEIRKLVGPDVPILAQFGHPLQRHSAHGGDG